ncbi:MAG: DNA polymerase I [Parcubacteria group bacterium]
MENKAKKLILIDGNAIIHRAYHALPPLMTKSGELVNAVYGFTSTMLSVIEKFQPDYIIATFDLAGPTFRHKEFAEYKAHRVKADQELYDQIPRVKEVVRAMGIPILELAGFEADDVIGTLSRLADSSRENLETMIVTGDLDTLQLVSDKTSVYTMRRGLTDSVLYGKDEIMARYGLVPSQLIDYKGLRGDPSDNIPGVKGIGEKTATELLKKYVTLEGVYQNIAEIKGAVKDKLERDKMQAIQSKQLATIVRSVPVELDLSAAKTHEFDRAQLVKLFQELTFFSLIKRIPGNNNANTRMYANDANMPVVDDVNVSEGVNDFKYEYIAADKAEEFFQMLAEQKEVAFCLKSHGGKGWEKEISSVAFSWKTGRAVCIAFGELKGKKEKFPLEADQPLAEKVKNIFENKDIQKIGYDLKSSIETLGKYGIGLAGGLYDVMVAAYVLDPGAKTELERLVLKELGEEIAPEAKKGQLGLMIESPEETSGEVCRAADYVFKLKHNYAGKIAAISAEQNPTHNLQTVFSDIEMPLVKILAEMEVTGVRLNTIIFKGISEKITARIASLEKSIYDAAGMQFNINSPKQLAEVLFSTMKLPTVDIKKGKTGYSTASSELQKLKSEHKIIEKIEEYREIFKLKTTYLDALPLLVDQNSRIHSAFNQTVTATGRLSSSEPNLQNIPIRTDLGQLLRVAFEAEKGWKLVAADYSQIDLRVVAHASLDKKMIELFWAGEDIHTATAAEINQVTKSQVTQKMRSSAKALNFGIIYGMSVFGFSASAGIDRDEAKKFIDAYFAKFTGVANYMRTTKEEAKTKGYVETEMGRRRYVPEINAPNFQVAQAGERMAINMPIQGMSADIVKLAMIKVYEAYENNPDVRMILQVHDEIILEVKEDLAEEVGKRVKEIMEQVYKLKVPLVVDVKVGDNWGEV